MSINNNDNNNHDGNGHYKKLKETIIKISEKLGIDVDEYNLDDVCTNLIIKEEKGKNKNN